MAYQGHAQAILPAWCSLDETFQGLYQQSLFISFLRFGPAFTFLNFEKLQTIYQLWFDCVWYVQFWPKHHTLFFPFISPNYAGSGFYLIHSLCCSSPLSGIDLVLAFVPIERLTNAWFFILETYPVSFLSIEFFGATSMFDSWSYSLSLVIYSYIFSIHEAQSMKLYQHWLLK